MQIKVSSVEDLPKLIETGEYTTALGMQLIKKFLTDDDETLKEIGAVNENILKGIRLNGFRRPAGGRRLIDADGQREGNSALLLDRTTGKKCGSPVDGRKRSQGRNGGLWRARRPRKNTGLAYLSSAHDEFTGKS